MPHLTPSTQDAPSRILEIRGGPAERSAVVVQVHGDGREEVLAEADLRLAPLHPVNFTATEREASFTVTATPLTPGGNGVARVAVHDQHGTQLALITKNHARSFLRCTFDVVTPNASYRVVEANLVLAALHLASMLFWTLLGLIPDRSRFHINIDGVRIGTTRRIARAYRCDVSARLDWRVAATIPLALETILDRRAHNRWSADRRYLKAVRDHEAQVQTAAVKTNPVDVTPRC